MAPRNLLHPKKAQPRVKSRKLLNLLLALSVRLTPPGCLFWARLFMVDPKSGDHRSTSLRLSGRELEIVRLLALGLTNKAIARDLGLSQRTIDTHLSRLYRRFDVHSRTQLALLWAQHPK
jgi:DNA-binding NarL/FixJ family response regulator